MRRFVILAGGFALLAGSCSLVGGGPTAPTEALGPPTLIDETSSSGLDHRYTGGSEFFEGGGVAVFDCNGDSFPEVFVAGGEGDSALYLNQSAEGAALQFTPDGHSDLVFDHVTGGYPIDLDSDGITDVAVLRIGENILMRGLGDCRFERANEALGFDGGDAWTAAFSATWEGNNQLPTLAFGNYLKREDALNQEELCEPNVVVRPEGSAYADPTQLLPSWCSLSVLFSDWDRNGGADLRITNDRQYNRSGEEQLWDMAGADPISYTRERGWNQVRIWGMGIASRDVTGDGFPEVFLTSQGDNRLQTLDGGADRPDYTDIAIRRGVTAHKPYEGDDTYASTGWHAQFEDVNNDGFVDLYIAKGNVDAMPDFTMEDPNNLLLGQPDGTFVEGGSDAGIVYFERTRGGAVVDLNGDGLLDLIEVNREAPVRVWRNVGTGTADAPEPMGNWITVEVVGGAVNGHAIGSWIEVRLGDVVLPKEVTIGGGHVSGQLVPHHFGIGSSASAEVRVIPPEGSPTEWRTVDAGELLVVSTSG